jgi:hypothetical protein
MGTRTGTYYTGTITGQVGSLITVLDAILVTGEGWTKPFTGTNGAHYQQAGGSGYQLFVNDNAPGAAGAREAIWRGCESATAYGVLTDAFPTAALVTDANCVIRKSDTADATPRTYWAVADDRFIILVIQFGTSNRDCYIFGDIEPTWTGDSYACIVNNRGTPSNTNNNLAFGSGVTLDLTSVSNANIWFARTISGTLKVTRGTMMGIQSARIGNLSNYYPYPHPSTSKLHMRRLSARCNGNSTTTPNNEASIRGAIPFFMEAICSGFVSALDDLDTFTDTAYDASSQFIIICAGSNMTSFNDSRYILQTAGTWSDR